MGRHIERLSGEAEYQADISTITETTQIRLVPEPGNPNDPRAIMAITTGGIKLGNVEQGSAVVKAMLDV
jgi:hypothetical protein